MDDSELDEVTEATRRAERNDASALHEADRPPTGEEEKEADEESLVEGVAEHYQEMAERGANQRGEGRIE
jgi:hypothetical protein